MIVKGDGNGEPVGWRMPQTASLRAQRSNPESLRGETLDCFAVLAMIENAANVIALSSGNFLSGHAFALSRPVSAELCRFVAPSKAGPRTTVRSI